GPPVPRGRASVVTPAAHDGGMVVSTLLLVLDLSGTFVFALSGAMVGVRKQLDIFGVLVLAFAAATAGGMTRDLLLGAVPPPAISDWRYIVVALGAGLITFSWSPLIHRLRSAVLVFDGAGLALFAVSGAQKALGYHVNPVAAVLLGVLTGIGGGMLRDVLVSEVPTVLRSELYAVAALAGAAVVVIGDRLPFPAVATTIAGALLCFGLRMVAVRRDWQLPTPRPPDQSRRDEHASSARADER
ncbi:MAG TPA: trimeric intracellular cation channel family protein, partial [Thermomicrobiaceae bacterium]|nr:trimeric intracellular cation channel family protein [Thermomicrobiaceae bacterium]